jgi:hypothetical protein
MADAGGAGAPCWCTALPAAVPVPSGGAISAACWCPACLAREIAERAEPPRRGDIKSP